MKSPKIVSDPVWGLIDISEFLPMIDTPVFQALGYKYQLGLSFLIFPAATHSRKQHSLGAFLRATRRAERWQSQGFINADQAKTLRAFALYHDIGHGPFSHTTESVYHIDHDEIGALKLRSLKEQVEKAGVDYAALEAMFTRKDPLFNAIMDKNVGAEKMDYLSRDAYYTIREMPGVEYLSKFVYFIEDKVVVDEKAIDQVRALQDFYMKMYKHVYLRKKSIIAQRMMEKMTYELLLEGAREEEIWNMTDFGLLGRFEISKNAIIKYYYQKLMANDLPRSTIEFRFGKFSPTHHIEEKNVHIFGLDDDEMRQLLAHELLQTPQGFKKLELELAEHLGIGENEILLVPPVFPAANTAKRFDPMDVNIYRFDGEIRQLSEFYPEHFNAMREYGQSHHAVRLCTFSDKRDELSRRGDVIRDFLLSRVALQ